MEHSEDDIIVQFGLSANEIEPEVLQFNVR